MHWANTRKLDGFDCFTGSFTETNSRSLVDGDDLSSGIIPNLIDSCCPVWLLFGFIYVIMLIICKYLNDGSLLSFFSHYYLHG